MKRIVWFTTVACGIVFAQTTTHDAPLEVKDGSVRVFFRSDTLIDPVQARARNLATNEEILQHTHNREHKIRIYSAGGNAQDRRILPSDQLHLRVRGPRFFFGLFPGRVLGTMKVMPVQKPGAGNLVAAHAAKLTETSGRCATLTGTALERCLGDNLPNAEKDSLDLVWVVQAPERFNWALQGNPDIPALIQAAASAPSHKAARDNAQKIEFLLRTQAQSTNVHIDRILVISSGGVQQGPAIPFGPGKRMAVCENRNEPDANGNFTQSEVCPAP